MKRAINLLTLLILPALLFSGCSQTPLSNAKATPEFTSTGVELVIPSTLTPTVEPSPTETELPEDTPTVDPASQITHYQIEADFDYSNHTMSVNEQVTFTNTSTEAYTNLEFQDVPNTMYGVFSLKSATMVGGQTITNYTLEDNRLTIPLDQPLPSGATSSISFSYDLNLPVIPEETASSSASVKPQVFGYSERQTNLVDWYLYLPPYQTGQGWVIHDPSYYGEFQVYPLADFDVTITPVNPPTGLQIAAPAAPQMENGSFHYQFNDARTFVWSASSTYVLKTSIFGSITINCYSFPLDDAAADMVLQNTVDAVKLYSQLFGPYQHTTFSMVEADFLDGMEYDGLVFLSKGFYNLYDGTAKGYLTIIAAHETAHQWWFAQVANDQAIEPWLDEAMATYSERLFYENVYPDLVSWWQAYRVDFYQPTGYINQSVYSYNGYTDYRNAVYLRGEQFLEALRLQIGDAAFFAFLKGYVIAEKGKIATTTDFFTILAQYTDQDISKLKTEYFK